MRPLRLDMHGFTVFHEPTTVDFTDTDFFALVGPTGSGKSTVLDAICFALYGTVPRWGDRRRIEHALAPSANTAKVRLVFESCGARFVATRVVRRDGKGKVSTSHAGLEQLPPGFNLALFDTAPAERGEAALGTVLAGTPAEMDTAVVEAIGLPYEQFTSCVLLPQGEFAQFLHAKPAQRQEILVNLLGLHVYQRVGERAVTIHRDAEAAAAALRGVLGDLTNVDDAAIAEAEQAVTAARGLAADLEDELAPLTEAVTAGELARAELTRVQQQLSILDGVRLPTGLATLAADIAAAREAADAANAAVLGAEENEEKARAELAAAGDRGELQRLVDAYSQRQQLAARVGELGDTVATAVKQHEQAAAALAKARDTAAASAAEVASAQRGVEAAQTADRAASLRVHLAAGAPCPVCEQVVRTVPATPDTPALRAARAGLAAAEKAAQSASAAVDKYDRATRQQERALAVATAQRDESAARLSTIDTSLVDAPDLSTIRSTLAHIADAEQALATAAARVRTARGAARQADAAAATASERLGRAWRDFDAVRDTLATLAPPPADRDDLVTSWHALADWARLTANAQRQHSERLLARAETALTAISQRVERIEALFAGAGVTVGQAGDVAAYRQAAALAVQRAVTAHERLAERREQAHRLADQLAAKEQEALVAKSLALHLRADRFERWLLAEALDSLVAGASRILRELSVGQYDLGHDKGEFYVVDHSDAGLRRGVRTLSGGETFQASLALALALAEQLAGLSTTATQLESIMLDEGFGTLDAASLDVVAATLETLAAKGDRVVGVVTHVNALAERIPVRFDVAKDARGYATVARTG